MLGEIQFVMVNGFINERPIPLVGFVGENDARQIKVVTFDDMSTVSVTELVIGDIEAGIFEAEQKTIPVFDRLSGAYVDRTQTTLSIYLNEEMLGDSGLKFLQLVMYNETGEIVKKTNQFIVRVGDSNTPVYYAPETKTVKTLETYVKDADKEIANLVFGLQEEVTSSSGFVNKKVPYVYKGNEEDYQNGYWYYYDDTQKKWVPGGPYKNPTDEVQRLLAQKQDVLTFDSTPTENSQNPVTSDGVFRALAGHQITMDEFPINGSTNPVTSDGLYRKFGEVDAQHQSLSTRVGRIQEEQTELANGVQQNTANISQNAANISSQGATIAEHQTSISENADAIEEVRGIANTASNKADAVDDRLDNIIVESGTSDAETIAARTNTNIGITYTTLGQRLDEENSEIKEDLSTQSLDIQSVSTLLSYPRNLFNKNFSDSTHTFSGWRQYSTIGSNGEVVYNSGNYATTTYLRTYGTKTVDIRYGSAQKEFADRNVACYTASKKFIGFCPNAVNNVRTLLDGTAYIIVEKYFGSNATTNIGNRVCVNPDWGNVGVYSAYHVPFNPNDVNLMQIFPKYTTIGDSLMCGFVNNGAASVSSAVAKEAGNNWVNYISLRIGRPFTNVAVGGSTTADWRNTHISTANVDTDCYIIGLGANDERHSRTLGTSADIKTDFSDNSDSFYGNYDYIVRQLMAWQDKAHIFCLTIPATETADVSGFNTAISYIAGLYPDKVHVINLNEDIDAYMLPIIADNFLGAHYNPVAYNIMSGIIEKAINKYMYINYSEFLGTPYV